MFRKPAPKSVQVGDTVEFLTHPSRKTRRIHYLVRVVHMNGGFTVRANGHGNQRVTAAEAKDWSMTVIASEGGAVR